MFDPGKLFYKMLSAYIEYRDKGERLIIGNEGGSRSSKTWSTYDLIIWICDHNRGKGLDIYMLRDTLIHCKDFTWKDFIQLLKIEGYYDEKCLKEYPKPYYNLWGNNIYARGMDDESSTEGYPSDILFLNEGLETDKSKFDGLKMRCRKLIIIDWNPKLTQHWVFDLEGQPNTIFFRSTYKDNKHLEQTIIDEIESYEPTEKNILNKTANLFRWRVYGLGERTDQEGNVFNDSQLNKFNLSDIDLQTAQIVAYGDVADQGIDYTSIPIAALIDEKVYIIDWIFTPKSIETWIPLYIEKLEQYNITKSVFESNNQGLVITKMIKEKVNQKHKNTIFAVPNTQNKHSRICIQAETHIIPDFYFLNVSNGMYKDAYNMMLNYKHDKSFKQDDAPDSLAGLSKISKQYR